MIRAAIRTKTAGRSLTLDLCLAGAGTDPGIKANSDPLMYWCVALWDKCAPRAQTMRSINGAAGRLKQRANPWIDIWGPASVVVATMMRIGWEVVSPLEWRTHRGIINIEDTCPRGVEKLAKEAAQNWLWSKMHGGDDALRDVPAMPLLEPIVKLLQPAARGRDWEAACVWRWWGADGLRSIGIARATRRAMCARSASLPLALTITTCTIAQVPVHSARSTTPLLC